MDNSKDLKVGDRILSMLLDHIFMCVIIVPFGIITGVLTATYFNNVKYSYLLYIVFGLFLFVYFNKDFSKGKSIAKTLIGFQIVSNKSKLPASDFQCFIRNMTIPIWPIEVIVLLIFPKRRLGDFLANTCVIIDKKQKMVDYFKNIRQYKLSKYSVLTLLVGIMYIFILVLILWKLK